MCLFQFSKFIIYEKPFINAKKLAELIREAGIKKRYFLYGRSDTIVKNPELIKIWKDIGLERVFVGLEFFRDEDLKYINKGSTVENNKEAVKILNANGILQENGVHFSKLCCSYSITRDGFV